MPPATAFPDDLAACHAMLAEMGVALTKKDATLANKDSVIEQLEHRVEEQKRELAKVSAERDAAFQLAFRKRQERYLDDPNQFLLDFGDNEDTASFAEGIADAADEQDANAGGEQASGPARHTKGLARDATNSCPSTCLATKCCSQYPKTRCARSRTIWLASQECSGMKPGASYFAAIAALRRRSRRVRLASARSRRSSWR